MKLTEKSQEVFDYVKENGGHVALSEIAAATGRTERSVGANITDLTKKGLAVREKVEVDGEDKPITYVNLTEDGQNFVPSDED